jgi:hypothetical protein
MIDGLRGICLVFMTAHHLPGNVLSPFSTSQYGPFGFFTSASAFVFLSGLIAGKVYGGYRRTHGDRFLWRRIAARFRKAYIAQIAIVVVLCFACQFHLPSLSASGQLDLFHQNPWKALLLGAALLYQPEFLGLLPMYLFFLIFTPLLLWQLQAGHARRVMTCSVLAWACSGLFIRLPMHPDGVLFGSFNPLGYQILYVVGLVFGEKGWQLDDLAPSVRKQIVAISTGLTLSFFLLRLAYASDESYRALLDRMHPLFSLIQMGPARVLNFAAFVIVLIPLIPRVRAAVQYAFPARWLVSLGQNSLSVFIWHILAVYAARCVLTPASPELWRIADLVVAIASLSIPVLIAKRADWGAPLFQHPPFQRIQHS